MRRWAALLVTIATSAGAHPRDGRSTIDLQSYQQKQFIVDAIVGGRERRFLFDTGEGVTMISPNVARAIGCQPWGSITGFRMLGERVDTPRCDDVRLTVAGRIFRAPSAMVYDLSDASGGGTGLDGAIGLDLFAGRVVTLKFGTGRVIVETPASAGRRKRSGIEVPIRLSRSAEGAALEVDIGVHTSRGIAWMELDSGNAGPTIFVSPAVAPLLGLRTDTKESQDVTAEIARNVVFRGKARVFPTMIMDGNIGLQFMRVWDLTLDLATGRAWIARSETPVR